MNDRYVTICEIVPYSIGGEVITVRIYFPNFQYSAGFLKKGNMNDLPWSVISVDPVPCRVTMWVAYTLAQVSADWSEIGKASTYLVKWSMKVSSCLFFCGVVKEGPEISKDVTWKGAVGSSISSGSTKSLSSFRL